MRGVIEKGGYVPIAKGRPGNSEGRTIRIESETDLSYWVNGYNDTNIGSMFEPAYAEDLCVDC